MRVFSGAFLQIVQTEIISSISYPIAVGDIFAHVPCSLPEDLRLCSAIKL